jgi:hypothetical protein
MDVKDEAIRLHIRLGAVAERIDNALIRLRGETAEANGEDMPPLPDGALYATRESIYSAHNEVDHIGRLLDDLEQLI